MDMPLTVLLSRVFGIFFVVVGATILLRRHYYIPVYADFVRERLTRAVISLIEFLAGLFLVVMHNEWSSLAAGIISLVGWMALLEGFIYLALPDRHVGKFFNTFNKPGWYVFGGLLAVAAGIYLAVYGFGLA